MEARRRFRSWSWRLAGGLVVAGCAAAGAQELRPYQPPPPVYQYAPPQGAPPSSLEDEFRQDVARQPDPQQLQKLADEFASYRAEALARRQYGQARQYDRLLEILRAERGILPKEGAPR